MFGCWPYQQHDGQSGRQRSALAAEARHTLRHVVGGGVRCCDRRRRWLECKGRTEARASTPAPTMFFAKLTVLAGTDAPLGSAVPAAAIKLCLAGAVATGRNAGRDAVVSLVDVSSEKPFADSASRQKRPKCHAAIVATRGRSRTTSADSIRRQGTRGGSPQSGATRGG